MSTGTTANGRRLTGESGSGAETAAVPSRQAQDQPAVAPRRPRVATVWLGGCSGCHMSFLDLDEFLIELSGLIDLVYSPIIDVKTYPENVDVCLIEGAVCNADNLELLRKIRARTKVLVAFGDCAVTGNVPAMRNQLGAGGAANVLQCAYIDNAQECRGLPAVGDLVPELLARVLPVSEAVAVEYYLPGCPPPAAHIRSLLEALLAGREPGLAGNQIKFG